MKIKYNLIAYKGSNEYKSSIIGDFEKWIIAENIPKSPEEIVGAIFTSPRIIEPSKSVFENYDLYPEKLGLPLWLAYLNRTIEYNNSENSFFNKKYRKQENKII